MAVSSDFQPSLERRRIRVDGAAQGVGFRAFVAALAARFRLTGWVLNSPSGADIEAQGDAARLNAFQSAIASEAPPLARIDQVTATPIRVDPLEAGFSIRESHVDAGTFRVPLDAAICPSCLAEILDPQDRRFRYPFTVCANCGPRYSIALDMPYTRSASAMRGFMMCAECQAEVDDPSNRRFQAEANACPQCGPRIDLLAEPEAMEGLSGLMDDVARAAALIKRGYVVAIKLIGGFRLACDATNAEAVARLRERKSRLDKPFAVMMSTLDEVNQHCQVSSEEASLLQSPSAPIVVLCRRPESKIAANVAPNSATLGVALPPSPLSHLLARDLNRPMVITSGNAAELPVIIDNDQALDRLAGIVDAFVLHNQPIHAGDDQAVWWVDRYAEPKDSPRQPARRSHGDAPYPMRLPWRAEKPTLAVGGDLKNAFCFMRDHDALISQHMGDVTGLETLDALRSAIERLSNLLRLSPQSIAHDLNPSYLTTRLARLLAEGPDYGLIAVQHHHAHIISCLAENGRDGPVIGIALDGGGEGLDGAIWGGEVLIASPQVFERAASLEYLPLPGDAAIHKPYRVAWAYLHAVLGSIPEVRPLARYSADERRIVAQQIDRGVNTPKTSSCGRLFDAVAGLLGVCTVATYDGHAIVALEQAANRADTDSVNPYPFAIDGNGAIRLKETLAAVVNDVSSGRKPEAIAVAFHRTVAAMFVAATREASQKTGIKIVALSGDSFQNRLLLRLTRQALRDEGFEVLAHRQVPANDGGLALGQAVIALHQEPRIRPPG